MRIKIKKYKKQHLDFTEAFSGYSNVEFVVCEDYKEVIDGSDVILSAVTYAQRTSFARINISKKVVW